MPGRHVEGGNAASRDAGAREPGGGCRAVAELRAVLFDMDGLLVDSEPLWFEAERSVMARLGGRWTEADQQHLVGGSLAHTVSYIRERAARPPEPAEIGRWLLDAMAALVSERGVALMPGAAELLSELAAAGIPRALVTSTHRRIAEAVLARTGLTFGVTVCAEDVRRGKPDPEPYLRAAALLGAPPGECVVLEDSPRGIAAARAAGCPVIAVPSMPGLPGVPVPGEVTGTAEPGLAAVASLREVDLACLRQLVVASCGSKAPRRKSSPGNRP
jgi:HAD superfamily hydrolase (TIGR01509 family)